MDCPGTPFNPVEISQSGAEYKARPYLTIVGSVFCSLHQIRNLRCPLLAIYGNIGSLNTEILWMETL
jgi:hypothetical protein